MYVLPQAAILHPTAAMLILSVEQQLSALPIITWIQYFPKKGFQPEERLETRVSVHPCNKEKSGCRVANLLEVGNPSMESLCFDLTFRAACSLLLFDQLQQFSSSLSYTLWEALHPAGIAQNNPSGGASCNSCLRHSHGVHWGR